MTAPFRPCAPPRRGLAQRVARAVTAAARALAHLLGPVEAQPGEYMNPDAGPGPWVPGDVMGGGGYVAGPRQRPRSRP